MRFCTLAYSPTVGRTKPSCSDIVLLLIEQPKTMLILADPAWKRVIQPTDHGYVQEVLTDFADRAKSDPVVLFEQASEINLGPLVTAEVGVFDPEDTHLASMLQRFVSLPV